MKKIYSFLMTAVLALAAMSSCSKINEIPEVTVQEIKFNISVSPVDPETKATKSGWTAGDKLSIWFNGNTQKTPDLVLSYDGTNWSQSAFRNDPDLTFTSGENCLCIYEWLNDLGSYQYDSGSFTHPVELGGVSCNQVGLTIFGSSTYTYDETSRTVTSTLGSDGWKFGTPLQIVIEGLDKTKAGQYTLITDCEEINGVSGFTVGGQLNAHNPQAGVPNEDGVAFYFHTLRPEIADGLTFTLTDYTDEVTDMRTFSVTGKEINTEGAGKCVAIRLSDYKFSAPYDITFDFTTADFELYPETTPLYYEDNKWRVKTAWAAGDKLNLWFNGNWGEKPDLVVSYDGTKWNASRFRGGVDFENANKKKILAYYDAFNDLGEYVFDPDKGRWIGEGDNSTRAGGFTRKTTLGDKEFSQFNMVFFLESNYTYDADTKTVSSVLGSALDNSFWFVTTLQVVVADLDPSKAGKYTLSINSESAFPQDCFDDFDARYNNKPYVPVAGVPNTFGDGVAFYFYTNAVTSLNKHFDDEFIFNLTDYSGKEPVSYRCRSGLKRIPVDLLACMGVTFNTSDFVEITHIDGREYVDFGLPSGTLWATANVGVDKPEMLCFGDEEPERGTFLAWGMVTPSESYDWDHYVYTDWVDNTWTYKDAASLYWGKDWCTPTANQLRELIDEEYTTIKWITDQGKNYVKISGKKEVHLQSSVYDLSKYLIDSIHEEGVIAYSS